jgi:hypothetical protein
MRNKILSNFFALPLIVFGFVVCSNAQDSDHAKKTLTEDGQYQIMQGIGLRKTFEGLEGKIELLIDARLTGGSYVMENKGYPPDADSEDAETKELFGKVPARAAVLRVVDGGGKTVDSKPLDCISANIRVVRLYGTVRPTYEATCDYVDVAPFNGDEASFFEVKNGRIEQLEAIDQKTGKKAEMAFVSSQRVGWKFTKTPKGKDILSLEPGWYDNDSGGNFMIYYRRCHFDGKRWVLSERLIKDDYWEDEFDFPPLSKFPKVR